MQQASSLSVEARQSKADLVWLHADLNNQDTLSKQKNANNTTNKFQHNFGGMVQF